MNERLGLDESVETRPSQEAATRARRPYAAPRVLSREPLESVAAVCSPAPPAKSNPGLCPSGPISS